MSLDSRLGLALTAAAIAAALTGCVADPTPGMVDASTIQVGPDGTPSVDCRSLAQPSVLTWGGERRPSMQWGCATYSNLAAQVANPQDLVAPATLGPADAAVAASAVRRYETDNVKALGGSSTSSSGSSGSSGSGGTTGSSN
ncbi:CpaD family pilus assembly lipoprotein [Burkholderia sp. 22PA0099]|uniref:CpaD family pilus assembly lipoprotein n=1 Tax=Burkholderia sp. 22PA0099 TaxID=3237372 RepID=UPI0039C423CF